MVVPRNKLLLAPTDKKIVLHCSLDADDAVVAGDGAKDGGSKTKVESLLVPNIRGAMAGVGTFSC